MKKQAKWLPILLTVAVIVGSGLVLFSKTRSGRESMQQELNQQGVPGLEGAQSPAQQKAIADGLKELEENGPRICGDAVTSAVHTKTGARYSFSTTCIPNGWQAE